MDNENKFVYKYSAKENNEIEQIRRKYLRLEENKLDELIRLDKTVQNSGTIPSLIVGIISSLVFGVGLCLAMEVIGIGVLARVLGIIVGTVGMSGMLTAYPIYRKVYEKTKRKLAPRILELTDELTGEKS